MDNNSDPNSVATLKHNMLVQKRGNERGQKLQGTFIGANMSRIIAKIIMGRLKDAYEK